MLGFKKYFCISCRDRIGVSAGSALHVNQRVVYLYVDFRVGNDQWEVNVGTMRELKTLGAWILVIDFRSHSPFFR